MKRTVCVLFLLLFVFPFCITAFVSANEQSKKLNIYEIQTPPTLDGVVKNGEYHTPIAVNSSAGGLNFYGSQARRANAKVYMCYDSQNLYLAVVCDCIAPHVAFSEGEHYIFNAHHLTCCIVPDDPKAKNEHGDYIYPDESGFNFVDFTNKKYCFEWTVIYGSKSKKSEALDHFGDLVSSEIVSYAASSANGKDTYEVCIPWQALTNSYAASTLSGEKGSVFGFDFTLGLTDIGDGYDNTDGNYLYLGDCYTCDTKNIRLCPIITCAGEYSKAPSVSDSGIYAFVIIALLSSSACALVCKNKQF